MAPPAEWPVKIMWVVGLDWAAWRSCCLMAGMSAFAPLRKPEWTLKELWARSRGSQSAESLGGMWLARQVWSFVAGGKG